MTHPFEEMLKRQVTGDAIMYRAALAEGVKIGERDMRGKLHPIICELCDMLDNSVSCEGPDREEAEQLIARAGRLLEDTNPEDTNNEPALQTIRINPSR